jgi:homocitrate synthase
VLGIGERNGITPLGGFVARMYADDPAAIKRKYDLRKLKDLDELVASLVSIEIPYNNFVTGKYAFHHKAGMHTKAIYINPNSYEILDPADFGLTRTINIAHRLTGHNAVGRRAEELGLQFGKDELRAITTKIKTLADSGPLSMDQLDALLREWVVA